MIYNSSGVHSCARGHCHRSKGSAEVCDVAWRQIDRKRFKTEELEVALREVLAKAEARRLGRKR